MSKKTWRTVLFAGSITIVIALVWTQSNSICDDCCNKLDDKCKSDTLKVKLVDKVFIQGRNDGALPKNYDSAISIRPVSPEKKKPVKSDPGAAKSLIQKFNALNAYLYQYRFESNPYKGKPFSEQKIDYENKAIVFWHSIATIGLSMWALWTCSGILVAIVLFLSILEINKQSEDAKTKLFMERKDPELLFEMLDKKEGDQDLRAELLSLGTPRKIYRAINKFRFQYDQSGLFDYYKKLKENDPAEYQNQIANQKKKLALVLRQVIFFLQHAQELPIKAVKGEPLEILVNKLKTKIEAIIERDAKMENRTATWIQQRKNLLFDESLQCGFGEAPKDILYREILKQNIEIKSK